MRGVAELVDRRDLDEPIAGADEFAGVAGERGGIAGHRDNARNLARRQRARLRLCALAWRIEDDGVEALDLRRSERPPEEVARLDVDRLEAGGSRRTALERGERGFVVIDGDDAGALGEAERERADAGKQVGHSGSVGAGREDQPGERRLACGGGLQERGRRQRHDCVADAQGRRPLLRDQLAMAGETGEIALLRNAGERRHQRRRQRAGAAHVDVEPGIGRGDLNVERLFRGIERFRNGPRGADRSVEAFGQDRAAVDRNDVVCACRREADFKHVMRAAPGVEHGPAAALAMRIDEIADRGVEAGLPQGGDEKVALPCPIRRGVPMLHGTAAAHAEMRTDRRDALRACRRDVNETPTVGVARHLGDLDRLAGQRAGDVERAAGASRDTVAAMAEPLDHQPFSHVRPR